MIPFDLLGRPYSLTEHSCGLGIPAPRIEVGVGRVEDGGKRKPTAEVLLRLVFRGSQHQLKDSHL